jgi:hypothetical protein
LPSSASIILCTTVGLFTVSCCRLPSILFCFLSSSSELQAAGKTQTDFAMCRCYRFRPAKQYLRLTGVTFIQCHPRTLKNRREVILGFTEQLIQYRAGLCQLTQFPKAAGQPNQYCSILLLAGAQELEVSAGLGWIISQQKLCQQQPRLLIARLND